MKRKTKKVAARVLLNLRLTPDQMKQIRVYAKRHSNGNVSRYVRKMCL